MFMVVMILYSCFFFQAEDGIRDIGVTGVQTCALPIWAPSAATRAGARGSSSARTAAPRRPRGSGGGAAGARAGAAAEIGRASCRERGEISVVAVSLKKITCDT